MAYEMRDAIALGLYFSSGGLQQVAAVRRVVDGERLGIADPPGVLAQDPRKDRVERTHADVAAAPRGDHPGDAFAHLLGRLVGEGEREDAGRIDPLFDHVGDARGEHARLARTGAGDDERRHVEVDHGVALRGVQPPENG